MAKQDCAGNKKAGILPLQKGSLYWVEPSATKAGWMLGCDSDGNQGRFQEVGRECSHYCAPHMISLLLRESHDVALQMLSTCVSLQCPVNSNAAGNELCSCEGTCFCYAYNAMTYIPTPVIHVHQLSTLPQMQKSQLPQVTLHAENGVFNGAMVKTLVGVYDITCTQDVCCLASCIKQVGVFAHGLVPSSI